MPSALTPDQVAAFRSDNWSVVLQEDVPSWLWGGAGIPTWGIVVPWNGLQVLVSADAAGTWHYVDISDNPTLVANVNQAPYEPADSSFIGNVEDQIKKILDQLAHMVPDASTALSWAPVVIGAVLLIALLPNLRGLRHD